MENVYVFSFCLAIFLLTSSASALLYRIRKKSRFNSSRNAEKAMASARREFKKKKAKSAALANKKELEASFAAAALFTAGAARSPADIAKYFAIGYIVSFAACKFIAKARLNTARSRRLKDIASLFEAVELYMKGGYSIYQALMLAKPLAPSLKREIDECLAYWPEDPAKALEGFKKNLGVQEGEILVSLLIHIQAVGTKDFEGILSREAFNVERLRRLKSENSMAAKPFYLMVYRFLPLASAIGIITGPLLYRTYVVLRDAKILGF